MWQSQTDIKTPCTSLFSTYEQINVENMFICLTEQTVSIMHMLKEVLNYFRILKVGRQGSGRRV